MTQAVACRDECTATRLLVHRIEQIEAEQVRMKELDVQHTEALLKIQTDTDMLVDIFQGVQTGIKFSFGFIKVMQWLAGVGAAVATIAGFIYFLKTGHFPQE